MRTIAIASLLLSLVVHSIASPAPNPAKAIYGSGRGESARRDLEALAAASPNDAQAVFFIGRLDMDAAHFESAAVRFEKAAALDPNRSEYWQWLGRVYGMQARNAGVMTQLRLTGKLRDALEKAVALDPANLVARDDLASFYMDAPRLLGGGAAKARAQAAEIKRRDVYAGTLTEGEIFQQEKRYGEAERAYLQAMTMFPDRMDPVEHLIELCEFTGDAEKAFRLCEKLATLRPADPNMMSGEVTALYYEGATAAFSGKRLAEGAAALRRYLRSSPDFDSPSLSAAHYRLGMIAEKQHDRSGARREYSAAVQCDAGNQEAREALQRIPSGIVTK